MKMKRIGPLLAPSLVAAGLLGCGDDGGHPPPKPGEPPPAPPADAAKLFQKPKVMPRSGGPGGNVPPHP